jgi:hypothetical protein
MTTQQLEDWLGQQKSILPLQPSDKEKAALEGLSQISAEIGRVATGSFEGILSFPWIPVLLWKILNRIVAIVAIDDARTAAASSH